MIASENFFHNLVPMLTGGGDAALLCLLGITVTLKKKQLLFVEFLVFFQ